MEPNGNMSDSYIKMAEESIVALQAVRDNSNTWTAATSYYICYYSLYSLMMKLGIKCEIHSCSLEFMRRHLSEFYSQQDIQIINRAAKARTDLQYYVDRPVDAGTIELISGYCKIFFIKTKDMISRLSEGQVKHIREELRKEAQKGA
ncbi:hypothetical protein HYU17_03410 [Candidatus Woesearchaeota archaeon]|nr:hypothetical protein [Candidatus Woesearchaeota archaeon]